MNSPRKRIDFEQLGYETALETGNPVAAQQICGLHIQACESNIQPGVAELVSKIANARARAAALHSCLYDRVHPVSDATMLAKSVALYALTALLAIVCVTSIAGHTLTFHFFGMSAVVSFILGITLTGIVAAAGHQLFEKLLVRHKALEVGFICAAFLLCAWGVLELAQARSIMADKASEMGSNSTGTSFVAGAQERSLMGPVRQNESDEQKVRQMLGAAVLKIMLAADAMLGILLGIVMLIRQDDDFVAWRKLRRLSKQVTDLERARNELLALVEIAKKRCLAGIMRATHVPRKRHLPYHQLPLIVLALLVATPTFAQTITRHEGILVDVSGSIKKGGAGAELFREYLAGVKQLLTTEPPTSRVWVSVISTDSFGAGRELLKGWTPDRQGVFTDDLNRARYQLVSSFQTRAASLAPVASGSDIIGGLWRLKALLESGDASEAVQRDIWIFSDMMNETKEFDMLALIPLGAARMLQRAKSHQLVVPLAGYRVHVLGASTAGVTPSSWNKAKTFWTEYFQAAGAELVSYSAEIRGGR